MCDTKKILLRRVKFLHPPTPISKPFLRPYADIFLFDRLAENPPFDLAALISESCRQIVHR